MTATQQDRGRVYVCYTIKNFCDLSSVRAKKIVTHQLILWSIRLQILVRNDNLFL